MHRFIYAANHSTLLALARLFSHNKSDRSHVLVTILIIISHFSSKLQKWHSNHFIYNKEETGNCPETSKKTLILNLIWGQCRSLKKSVIFYNLILVNTLHATLYFLTILSWDKWEIWRLVISSRYRALSCYHKSSVLQGALRAPAPFPAETTESSD